MDQSTTTVRKPLEPLLAPVMFALSVAFLLVVASILHRQTVLDQDNVDLRVELALLALLWPVFFLEGSWRLLHRDRSERLWKQLAHFLLICLAPPLRIGARSHAPDRAIWLPRLGWQKVDRELRGKLERFFSVPMIVIALMVLPLLAIEFGWKEVRAQQGVLLFLAIGTGVIWFAFALEFIIMVSVAKKKLLYSTRHWVDLAVILLPVVQFLPDFLPLFRLVRAGGVLRLGIYRMQSLALKLWRAVLLLELVQRLTGQTLEKRLRKLKDLFAAKEEELEELRQEIEELQKQIVAQKQAEAVKEANPERPNMEEEPQRHRAHREDKEQLESGK